MRIDDRVRRVFTSVVATLVLLGAAPPAPERWVATSTTAIAITGDARYTPATLGFSGGGGRQLQIVYLKQVSGRVSFVGDTHAKDYAKLYRVVSPADILLKNKSPLCGQKPTYVTVMEVREATGGMAYLTVYTGSAEPTGAQTDKICSGYVYSIVP